MDELMEAIGKVFKKEKVKYHTLQVEMDSAYNWRNRDEILEYEGAVKGEACETTIRVYDAQPKDKAKELLAEVRQAVWEFIDQHPNCDYHIDMQEAFNRRWSSPIRVENMYKDIREQFRIADGAIIGSSLKEGGKLENPISEELTRRLLAARG